MDTNRKSGLSTDTIFKSRTECRAQEPTSTKRPSNAERADPAIRIMVVHGERILRSAFVTLLETVDDFIVVSEASSCADCCQKMATLRPDVLVCYLPASQSCNAPHVDCLSALNPETPVIVFTGHDEHLQVLSLARQGFRGLLTNDAARDDLFEAIRAVKDGGHFFDQRTQSVLVSAMRGSERGRDPAIPEITERELKVLELLAQGKTNAAVASALHLSTSTVKHCVSSVLVKLDAPNRTAAVRIAVAKGLLPG